MIKILTIEDRKDIRDEIVAMLRWEAYDVYEANDGSEGLHLAFEVTPDLILCDIMMPGLDGYQLFEQLAAHSETASIPFIFLTAKSDPSAIRHGMSLGADDYVTKPFIHSELLSAIRTRLEKRDKAEIKHLQALSRHLIEVQDSERQQTAQFLHEMLDQRLSGLKMALSVVRQITNDDTYPLIEDAQRLLDGTLERLQAAESQLWPVMVNQLGLLSTLLWQVNQFTAQTAMTVHFSHDGLDYPFALEIKIAVFRILQEILDKVEQDMLDPDQGDDELQISATLEANVLSLTVDGIEIEAQELMTSGSYPLMRLRERVATLNGTLETGPSRYAAAFVTINIPVEMANDDMNAQFPTRAIQETVNDRRSVPSSGSQYDNNIAKQRLPPVVLTRREREILKMIGDGRKNSEIADVLNLSVRTVETHRANIMQKLGLHSKHALIFYALQSKPE